MTQAVCFKCGAIKFGAIKFGAFCPCPDFQAMPKCEEDLAISLAMTDHYFDLDALKQIGASVRERGEPPLLHPETREHILATIRSAGGMMARLGDQLEAKITEERSDQSDAPG